jgi:hypothetical protein
MGRVGDSERYRRLEVNRDDFRCWKCHEYNIEGPDAELRLRPILWCRHVLPSVKSQRVV